VARQLAEMQRQFAQERDENVRARKQERAQAVEKDAGHWVDEQVRSGRTTAAERPNLIALYTANAADDDANPLQIPYRDPATGSPKLGGRLDVFKAGIALRPASDAGTARVAVNPAQQDQAVAMLQQIASQLGMTVLSNAPPPSKDELKEIYDLAAGYAHRMNGAKAGGPANAR
jgi:hypothetical protein